MLGDMSVSYLFNSLLFSLPLVGVAFVGSLIALVRWPKHPQVSALVLASLISMAAFGLLQHFGTYWLLVRTYGRGLGAAENGFLLGLMSLAYTFVRTTAWIGILTALFGWRADPPNLPPIPKSAFQFSILSLLILTTIVAVLCVVLRWIVTLIGDSAMVLIQFVDEIPLVTCWLLGLRLAIVRWPKHPAVSLAALWGIGIALAMFLASIVNFLLIVGSGVHSPLLSFVISLGFAVMSVIGWAFTLTAVFGWRETPTTAGEDTFTHANGFTST